MRHSHPFVPLANIFSLRNHLEVPRDVKTADVPSLQRNNVVDLMRNASLTGAGCRSFIYRRDVRTVRPCSRRVAFKKSPFRGSRYDRGGILSAVLGQMLLVRLSPRSESFRDGVFVSSGVGLIPFTPLLSMAFSMGLRIRDRFFSMCQVMRASGCRSPFLICESPRAFLRMQRVLVLASVGCSPFANFQSICCVIRRVVRLDLLPILSRVGLPPAKFVGLALFFSRHRSSSYFIFGWPMAFQII